MLVVYESKRSLEEVVADMEPTVQQHKFGVMTVHNLKETMARKGVTLDNDCYVFEICNPGQAKKVLESHMEVSSVLPCRISVYREGGKVRIVMLKPTAMLAMFGASDLRIVAQEVEDVMASIMRAVAG
jgi:uncharacterized protein (DUF302 family)